MNIYKRRGISLIVLVITIIVIGILAGTVILSIAKGSPISDATKAVFLSDVSSFKDELNIYIGKQYIDTLGVFNPAKLNADEDDVMYDGLVDTSKTISDIIPSMKEADKYLGDFAIIEGILVFKGYEDDKQEWAKNSGMEVISAVFYSGNVETYTVWETAKYKLEVWGGEGGSFFNNKGGLGGYAGGEIDLTAGQVLYINVGGMGNSGGNYAQPYSELPPADSGLGGYNGGGNGGIYFNDWAGGDFRVADGGGGATDVRIDGTGFANRILVAGGGGGAGTSASGGDGGGDSGTNGSDAINTITHATGGLGGTQTAGGNGGVLIDSSGYDGFSGTLGIGADAYRTASIYGDNPGAGGGGGGGYYGGGSGGQKRSWYAGSGGGGGSGYIGTLTNASTSNGVQSGNGKFKITKID